MSILEAAQELATALSKLDCGDHSCLFATDKTGMRTNGGCRCLEGKTKLPIMKFWQSIKDNK